MGSPVNFGASDLPELQYPSPSGNGAQDRANYVAFANLVFLRSQVQALKDTLSAVQVSSAAAAAAAGASGATGSPGSPGPPGGVAFVGTHVIRLSSYPPDPAGAEFFETDRHYLYIVSNLTGINLWNYAAGVSYGTHANRWTDLGANDAGALYYETDRTALYEWNGTVWTFLVGLPYSRTQSQLAALAATLGATDVGFRAFVSDFSHTLVWSGAAWTFADGDAGSLYVQAFIGTPTGGTWHACDGSANVKYLKADGTTGTVTVPDLSGSIYIKGGGYTGPTPTAATNPTWTAGSKTDDESAHTHDVTIANNINVTLGGGGNNAAAAQTVTSAAGTAHHHNLSDANAKLNKIGDTTWSPDNMGFAWFFRQ